jgi:cytochrome P450
MIFTMFRVIIAATTAVVLYIAFRLSRIKDLPGLPRIGKPGFKGFVSTAFRFIFDTEGCIDEGWTQFSGSPFMIPTLAGSIIILGPEHVELLRTSNDTVFNQPIAVKEDLQLDHTMNEQLQRNPFHTAVVRSDLTRAIASLVPEVLDETKLAMTETFKLSTGSKSTTLPLFHTMTYMIGRISNRAMLGTQLCRNDAFLRAIVNFAENVYIYAVILSYLPQVTRPMAYFVLSSLFGGKKEPAKFIIPYLKLSLLKGEESEARPNIADLLIRNAPPTESLQSLAVRVMFLNFGSIHTSSLFISQALFELASLPPSDLNSIRAEITHALEVEGGWNKPALARFHKIDSVLREVGRLYGLNRLGMNRLTMHPAVLPSGIIVPAGYKVSVDLKAIHFNPATGTATLRPAGRSTGSPRSTT